MYGHEKDCDCNVCEQEMLAERKRQRDVENRKAIYLEGKITGRLEAAREICEYLFGTMPNSDGERYIATIREKFGLGI